MKDANAKLGILYFDTKALFDNELPTDKQRKIASELVEMFRRLMDEWYALSGESSDINNPVHLNVDGIGCCLKCIPTNFTIEHYVFEISFHFLIGRVMLDETSFARWLEIRLLGVVCVCDDICMQIEFRHEPCSSST
jgi:hypothetical protein